MTVHDNWLSVLMTTFLGGAGWTALRTGFLSIIGEWAAKRYISWRSKKPQKYPNIKLAEIRMQKSTENHLWRELALHRKKIDRLEEREMKCQTALAEAKTERTEWMRKVESLLKWKQKAEVQLDICKKRRLTA